MRSGRNDCSAYAGNTHNRGGVCAASSADDRTQEFEPRA